MMPMFLRVRVIFVFRKEFGKRTRVSRPRECGPRIHQDARLKDLGTRVRMSRTPGRILGDTKLGLRLPAASAAQASGGRRARRAATDVPNETPGSGCRPSSYTSVGR